MATHASDTEVGPGDSPLPDARTTGQSETPFRFSRLRKEDRTDAAQLDPAVLEELARAMARGGGGESKVPAGYTYLGQFVAHDLSFERSRPGFDRRVRRAQLVQARSPRLDLDSLYGDPASFEADNVRMTTGMTAGGRPGLDLPRNLAHSAKAAIADPRNDDNLAVAQIHLAFIRFHNAVVDDLEADGVSSQELLEQARNVVTKHYQLIIRTDYLDKVCDPAVVNEVFTTHKRKLFEVDALQRITPTMPIEFSVAAFRFGHSMLRTNYKWNDELDGGVVSLDRLFELTGRGHEAGWQIPDTAVADFRRLFDFGPPQNDKLNAAMRIDTALVRRLGSVPPAVVEENEQNLTRHDPRTNIAYRDLMRARQLGLATGQQMAQLIRACGDPVQTLQPDKIAEGDNGAQLDGLGEDAIAAIAANTPLWFYVLREAELQGGTLHGVGARIVVEVIHRAVQASSASIVTDSAWRPRYGPGDGTFRMTDLLEKAFGPEHLDHPLGR